MRVTVSGFSQREVLKRKMEAGDCILLKRFQGNFCCELRRVKLGDTEWALVDYQEFHTRLPILSVASAHAAYRRLNHCFSSSRQCQEALISSTLTRNHSFRPTGERDEAF